jgi:hypothetical protein
LVINPRGTSGSGKTTIIRGIMEKATKKVALGDNPRKPEGYVLDLPGKHTTFVLGSYENTCGGCDTIKTQDEIVERVIRYAVGPEFAIPSAPTNVLFEGLLMSHTFARYAALDRLLNTKGVHCIWAFLDTPLEVCLERVNQRRQERTAGAEPVNPHHTSEKWNGNRATFRKFDKGNGKDWASVNKILAPGVPKVDFPYPHLDARWVPYQDAVETVFSWLD